MHLSVTVGVTGLAVRTPAISFPPNGIRCDGAAARERPPEPVLVGPLATLEYRLGRLPPAELAEHLEGLVHEVGSELPLQGVPASAALWLQAPRASGLCSTSSGPATGPRTLRRPWTRVASERPQFRDSCFAPLPQLYSPPTIRMHGSRKGAGALR